MRIGVSTTTDTRLHEAAHTAEQLGLQFCQDPADPNYEFILVFTDEYVGLHKTSERKFAPFHIDFTSGKMQYRSKHAGLRKELIARAMGAKPSEHPRIVDATAGLGRDSFILATLGFEVTLLERSPILYTLLKDALLRAQNSPVTAPIAQRMHLIHSDAIEWLRQLSPSEYPDVVYLDPMFPERQKSASVKKDMAYLQELLGKDQDADNLLNVALTCAGKRVVVKRPRLAANIAEIAPNYSLDGKSSRFDVYLSEHKWKP